MFRHSGRGCTPLPHPGFPVVALERNAGLDQNNQMAHENDVVTFSFRYAGDA